MKSNDFMNKVRQWDNKASQWMIKHFYLLFFEFILVGIFIAVFINALKVIDISTDITHATISERLLSSISGNILLLVILLLFNSFWMLYIFSSLIRMRSTLKSIDFNLSRRRDDSRNPISKDELNRD